MKIYASNLAAATTETNLRDAFAAYGTVSNAHLAKDKESGKLKGFGYVEMQNDDEAKAAIAALNSSELGGNIIRVLESTSKDKSEATAHSAKG